MADRTRLDAYGWLDGQVTVRYTGTCSWDPMILDVRTWSYVPSVTFTTTWDEDEYVYEQQQAGEARNATILRDLLHVIGDSTYISGSDSTIYTLPAPQIDYGNPTQVKTTRTVVVR